MKSRIVLVFSLFLIAWLVLIGRSLYLQVLPNEKLGQLEDRQFSQKISIESHRGSVFDRNGKELAVTVSTYSLFADPKIMESPRKAAKQLAHELRLSYAKLYKLVKPSDKRFVWIQRHLSFEQKEKIQAWGYRGLAFVEESKRIYPNEGLLKTSLGVVGRNGKGLEGIELLYDKYLKGSKKEVRVQRDARGRPLVVDARHFIDQPDGKDIYLTIDGEIQYFLESELRRVVDEYSAAGAMGVVLDAQTSEILSIANVEGGIGEDATRVQASNRNKTVTDFFEPGSTIKPFIAAGAIREGLALPNTEYDCGGGKLKIGRRVIREADASHGFDKLTLAEIIAHSSNVGITKVSFQLGQKRVRSTLRDFGFGESSGVDLPGEVEGILHSLPWKAHQLSNISFGHAMTSTALQIANAYAAIANGGLLRRPFIVKSVTEENWVNPVLRNYKPRRVLTEEQSKMMKLILSGVTSRGGTGYSARVNGYPVAGKTGTAQKVKTDGRGYKKGAYLSSFAGFIPVNEPRYVIYVMVDEPQGEYYGATVAAPLFSSIAQFAMRKSDLAPVLISKENVVKKLSEVSPKKRFGEGVNHSAKGHLPNVLGMSLREAMHILMPFEKKIKIAGKGRVVRSWPDPGDSVEKVKQIRLKLEVE
ncbi:MAG: cell division protein [Bdellovibrionales bacterium]|nr:cell division protein [Bdellovibrionales bacterium]